VLPEENVKQTRISLHVTIKSAVTATPSTTLDPICSDRTWLQYPGTKSLPWQEPSMIFLWKEAWKALVSTAWTMLKASAAMRAMTTATRCGTEDFQMP
jgi:hypothetical protein